MARLIQGAWSPVAAQRFDGGTTCDVNFGVANAQFNSDLAQTVMVLYRPIGQNNGNSFHYIYSKSDSAGNGMRFLVDPNAGSWRAQFDMSSTGVGSSPSRQSTPNSIVLGYWHHIAGTYVGGGSLLTADLSIYIGINGAPLRLDNASGVDGTGTLNNNAAHNMHIGEREGSTNRPCFGDLAYVVRWPRVLTLGEMQMAQALGPQVIPDYIFFYANNQDYGPYRLTGARTGVLPGQAPLIQPGLNFRGARRFTNTVTATVTAAYAPQMLG